MRQGRSVPVAMLLAALALSCGPGRPPSAPAGGGGAGGPAQSGAGSLPEGKVRAEPVAFPSGTLVTKVDEDQSEMVYAAAGPFGPLERLARAMEESEIAFRQEPIGAEPGAFHDLWGGMLEPDPFLVLVTQGDIQVGKPYAADPAVLAEVESLFGSIQDPSQQDQAFCDAIRDLIERDPKMPVLHERLAGCLQQIGEKPGAIAALEGEIAVNPAHPGAQLSLAVIRAASGKPAEARDHALKALLYYPAFPAARKWLAGGGLPGSALREESFAPRVRIDLDQDGVVVSKAPEGQPWVASWASCKAGFRWAPEVRMAFGMSAGPWKPSLLEEMICLRIAADAYEAGVAAGRPGEAIGDVLAGATQGHRLMEAAFFEVIGWHDPDMMKMLPPEIRDLVVAWIEDTVLVPATQPASPQP